MTLPTLLLKALSAFGFIATVLAIYATVRLYCCLNDD